MVFCIVQEIFETDKAVHEKVEEYQKLVAPQLVCTFAQSPAVARAFVVLQMILVVVD